MKIMQRIPSSILIEVLKSNNDFRNNNGVTVSDISRDLEASKSHVLNVTSELEEEGYICKEKKGRRKNLKLTDSGDKLAKLLIEVQQITEDDRRVTAK